MKDTVTHADGLTVEGMSRLAMTGVVERGSGGAFWNGPTTPAV